MSVTVTRTGGFAGLRREWVASASAEDAGRWIELIDECPWEAAATPAAPRGADLFVWRIAVRCAGAPPRDAVLAEDALDGPWRALVDRVRTASGPSQSSQNGA